MRLLYKSRCPVFVDPRHDYDVVRTRPIQKYGRKQLGIETVDLNQFKASLDELFGIG